MSEIITREAWMARYAKRLAEVSGMAQEAAENCASYALANGAPTKFITPEAAVDDLTVNTVDHEGAID